MDHTPLLEFKNIAKDYYGNKVLHDINFTLEQGQILGLVGENGAGKSTLVKLLFGMPDITGTGGYQGQVLLNGKELNYQSPFDALDDGIGMVHQEFSLIQGFSATENISLNRESLKKSPMTEIFGPRLSTLDREKMTKRSKKAIDLLGVKLAPETLVADMPVGYRQFTEIARELEKENIKLLILDEPTAVLTESEAEILLQSMKKLAQKGISIIFISHRLQEVMDVTDKILVLRDGYIVKNKAAEDITIKEISQDMVGRSVDVDKRDQEPREFNTPIMSVKNLWVDMPGETVRDVTLDIKEGEILGIGGLAGQGKLGIPNGIMGLQSAGGKVIFKGETLKLNSPRLMLDQKIAFVAEDRRGIGLLLEESLDWNISFTAMQVQDRYLKPLLGGLIKWRDNDKIKEVTQHYIDQLKIKCTSMDQKAMELSGGNQQKVCLAKAFATEPDLLFVSEPTRGIDIGAKEIVLNTLREYNRTKGTTIVIISSELEELRSICDRIAIVDEGQIAGTLKANAPSTDFGALMIGNVSKRDEK